MRLQFIFILVNLVEFFKYKKEKVASYFGEIHPNIQKKIDVKTEALFGFEIFVDNLEQSKKTIRDQKKYISSFRFSKIRERFCLYC